DYLEGEMDEKERDIVHTHVELCARCREDLLSLKEFMLLVEPELEIRYSFPGLLQRFVELLKLPIYKRFTFAYPALFILCILSYLITIISFRGNPSPTQKTVVFSGKNPGKTPAKVEEQSFGREKGKEQPLLQSSVEPGKPDSPKYP